MSREATANIFIPENHGCLAHNGATTITITCLSFSYFSYQPGNEEDGRKANPRGRHLSIVESPVAIDKKDIHQARVERTLRGHSPDITVDCNLYGVRSDTGMITGETSCGDMQTIMVKARTPRNPWIDFAD